MSPPAPVPYTAGAQSGSARPGGWGAQRASPKLLPLPRTQSSLTSLPTKPPAGTPAPGPGLGCLRVSNKHPMGHCSWLPTTPACPMLLQVPNPRVPYHLCHRCDQGILAGDSRHIPCPACISDSHKHWMRSPPGALHPHPQDLKLQGRWQPPGGSVLKKKNTRPLRHKQKNDASTEMKVAAPHPALAASIQDLGPQAHTQGGRGTRWVQALPGTAP